MQDNSEKKNIFSRKKARATGDFRILYRIDDASKRIFIDRIERRKDACL